MAQSSPQKLPRGKASSYCLVALSEQTVSTKLLEGLSIATCNPTTEADVKCKAVQKETKVASVDGDQLFTVSTRMSCNFCAVVFANRTEQKAHFKSDWHRYNLKQHIKGDNAITEEQFEVMTGDLSSISGSDDTSTSPSDNDNTAVPKATPKAITNKKSRVYDSSDSADSETEENANIMAATRKHPKVFLRNGDGQLISLYRSVLYHKKNAPSTPAELLSLAEQAHTYTRVAMVMLAGGHFSAAIFDGTTALVHKTFHRYVVRAKRGTVQSVRDGQGSAPKSGGASLRRYNEAALMQEIQELLASWSEHLKACHLIFLRTSTYSRHIFFGGKTPIFRKDDQRVRTVPFTTGRPTFNEAKRVHQMLMTVECFGAESLATDFVPVSPPRHLHPDTGHLVVRPDSGKGKGKGKERRAGGDKAGEKPKKEPEAETKKEGQSEATYEDDNESDDQSEGEVQLVETMTEIATDHLQEFACSVKRSKKKKKRNAQKETGQETTSEQQESTAEQPQGKRFQELGEEEARLKDQLYTCCRSGDAVQLSHLLQQLSLHASQASATHVKNSVSASQRNQSETPTATHSYTPKGEDSTATHSNNQNESCFEPTSAKVHNTNNISHNSPSQEAMVALTHDELNNKTDAPGMCGMDSSIVQQVDTNRTARDSETAHTCDTVPSDQAYTLVKNGSELTEGTCIDKNARQRIFNCVVHGAYGSKGLRLLHIAASSGHGNIVTLLLDAGCDPTVRDDAGKLPYNTASNKDVRNAFRRFRGKHPDQYDYDLAQIPTGLTADMEAERRQKEAEKKKAQKKAKQERLKEKKAEEAKEAAERKEKERFLALSDREKRALAAEKRLLTQTSPDVATPVLNRCYQCGADISGKVPFVYLEFQFCSPKCLKEHRLAHSKTK